MLLQQNEMMRTFQSENGNEFLTSVVIPSSPTACLKHLPSISQDISSNVNKNPFSCEDEDREAK